MCAIQRKTEVLVLVDLLGQWLVQIPKADLRMLSMIGIGVHWWILQYTLGLPLVAVIFEILSRYMKREEYLKMSRTFSKVLAINFAVGAATGTLSEFGLVLFWPNLLVLVGMYFFFPMYLEVFAFVAEALFVYMYFYTWDRVKPNFHIVIGLLAASGAILSALMIVSVNTLMSVPPGLTPTYNPATGAWSEPMFTLIMPNGEVVKLPAHEVRNLIASNPVLFHAILFATVSRIGIFGIVFNNPAVLVSWGHSVLAALVVTSFSILGVYSWRYLTARNESEKEYYLLGLKAISLIALIFIAIQGGLGDASGKYVAHYNPEKLAAFEGTSSQIISLSRLLGIEWLMAMLSYGSPNAHLPNYDTIPAAWRPPLILHYIYYTKIGLAMLLGLDVLLMVLLWYILKKNVPKILIKINVLSPIIAQLVSTLGWGVREIGRKPWTIYGLLTVDEAATPNAISILLIVGVTAYIVLVGVALLLVIYYVFRRKEENQK